MNYTSIIVAKIVYILPKYLNYIIGNIEVILLSYNSATGKSQTCCEAGTESLGSQYNEIAKLPIH